MYTIFHQRQSYKNYASDTRGSVMIITALSVVALILAMGMGVDLGRQQLVRTKVQQATDAAAQAAIQATTNREQIALAYFNMNYPSNYMGLARPTPSIATTGGKVSVSADVNISTVFMRVAGINAVASSAVTELPIPTNIIISPLYCWGANGAGAAGNGTTNPYAIPTAVVLPPGVKSIESLRVGGWDSSSCALTDTGGAYCWGKGSAGSNGNGAVSQSNAPVPVVMPPGVSKFTQLSDTSGFAQFRPDHVCAVGDDGNAYCWGLGLHGQIGDGFTVNRTVPTKVDKPSGVNSFKQLAVGDFHTCAIADDDNTYCWGTNNNGQLGKGAPSGTPRPLPTKLDMPPGVTKFTKIDAEWHHTCAIADTGDVYCWGAGWLGALGNGSQSSSNVPQKVLLPNNNYAQVSIGHQFGCAVAQSGALYCWGRNRYGSIGNGQADSGIGTVFSPTPEMVPLPAGISGFKSVSAGFEHTCALGSDNNGYCWGSGTNGEVSADDANKLSYNLYPVKVKMPNGVNAYTNIQVGGSITCAQVDVP